MNESTFRHWSKEIADYAISKFGQNQVVCAGWSPSGIYHIGNSREAVTCNAIHKSFQESNVSSKFIFVVDNYDPLDKIPVNLKKYSKQLRPYLGQPLVNIPDFSGNYETYSDFFINGAIEAMEDFQFEVEFVYAYDLYQQGFYDLFIHKYWKKREEIDDLFVEISGNVLDTYVSVVCNKCGNIKTTSVLDVEGDKITFQCQDNGMYKGCNSQGLTVIKDHNWKLKWRLDWPARQSFLGVTVEPSGKDHSVAGGSVDTAIAIHEQIFEETAPILERYGFITMKGKKFSGSKGGVLPANRISSIMPPSAYLFLIYRSDMLKDINFNPESMEYASLLDEFDIARQMALGIEIPNREREYEKLSLAANLAMNENEKGFLPAKSRFTELALVFQTSLNDPDLTISKLKDMDKFTGEQSINEIRSRLNVIENWLNEMAPENIKITFIEKLNNDIISYWNPALLQLWKNSVSQMTRDTLPEEFTNILRSSADQSGMGPKDFYPPFYQLILGKSKGPNASNLVCAIGKTEILTRLNSVKEMLSL